VIITTRIGADPLDAGWRASAGDGLQLTIDLTPLAPAESERIARSFPAAEAFAAKYVERATGNALFLEQFMHTAGDLVDGRLPIRIQSVVLARTDLLAPSDTRAIEALVRDGVYASLTRARRRQLHRPAAEVFLKDQAQQPFRPAWTAPRPLGPRRGERERCKGAIRVAVARCGGRAANERLGERAAAVTREGLDADPYPSERTATD
jgi:hypothetical protein